MADLRKIKTNHHKSDVICIYATCTICIWSFMPGEWFHYSNNDIEKFTFVIICQVDVVYGFCCHLLFELICSGYYGG